MLLYGAETWALTKSLTKRLSGFDTRAQRIVCNIRWPERVSNAALRQLTGLPPLARTLVTHRLRWFGHLLRAPATHPTKRILEFAPATAGWRRPRGPPRVRYCDTIREDLGQLRISLEEARTKAANRTEWRSVVASVVSTPARHEN